MHGLVRVVRLVFSMLDTSLFSVMTFSVTKSNILRVGMDAEHPTLVSYLSR